MTPLTSEEKPAGQETQVSLGCQAAELSIDLSCLAVGIGTGPRQAPVQPHSRGDLHLVGEDVRVALKERRLPEREARLDPYPRPDPLDGVIRRQPWKKQLLGREGLRESRIANIAI